MIKHDKTKVSKCYTALLVRGEIDTWFAIKHFNATRLAAYIYRFQKELGMKIEKKLMYSRDGSHYTKYIYRGFKRGIKNNKG